MNVVVHADDERAIEVLAAALPIHYGAQLAVDIILRSALTASGLPSMSSACTEIVAIWWSSASRLVGAAEFIDQMASGRAREALPVLRSSAHLFWRRGWMRMLAVSCGRALAVSLVSGGADRVGGSDGPGPDLADLFCEV